MSEILQIFGKTAEDCDVHAKKIGLNLCWTAKEWLQFDWNLQFMNVDFFV